MAVDRSGAARKHAREMVVAALFTPRIDAARYYRVWWSIVLAGTD